MTNYNETVKRLKGMKKKTIKGKVIDISDGSLESYAVNYRDFIIILNDDKLQEVAKIDRSLAFQLKNCTVFITDFFNVED